MDKVVVIGIPNNMTQDQAENIVSVLKNSDLSKEYRFIIIPKDIEFLSNKDLIEVADKIEKALRESIRRR